MKAENSHGLTFTCDAPDALELFDRTVRNYLAFSTDTGGSLKELLKSHPGTPMAHCLRGYFMMLMGVRALVPRALKEAAAAQEFGEAMEPREHMHVEALLAWAGGSLAAATSIWGGVARAFPRDILALKMAHFGYFYTGQSRRIRDGVAQALDFWSPADREYSFLNSMYAFGLEESGNYEAAERVGRGALERHPDDPWGIHALAHVFEGTERFADGERFIVEMDAHWRAANNFRYHVAWHRALLLYESGAADATLAAYDHDVFDASATEDLDICNDSSLLLRIELCGLDVDDRWRKIAEKVERRENELMLPFVDVHFVLALASSDDPVHRTRARALTEAMEAYGATSTDGNALVYREAGAPIAKAIIAYRENRGGDAWRTMNSVMDEIQSIGGSHAQRDLFREIAADALWQSEPYGADAIALYGARSRGRPRDEWNWKRYLAALAKGGSEPALQAAQARHETAGGAG